MNSEASATLAGGEEAKTLPGKEGRKSLLFQTFLGFSLGVWAVVTSLTSSHSQSSHPSTHMDRISEFESILLSLRMLIDATL